MVLKYVKIKTAALTFLAGIAFTTLRAQVKNLCPEVVNRYDAAVTVRIYDIPNIDKVNCAGQTKIAALIHQKDSIKVYALQQNVASSKLQKDIKDIDLAIKSLLPASEKNEDIAEKITAAEIESYKKIYRLSSSDSDMLSKFFRNKNNRLKRAFAEEYSFSGSDTIAVRDIVYGKAVMDILNRLYAYNYFDKEVQVLTSIKPLPDSSFKKFKTRYYDLIKQTSGYSDKERFDIAFKQTITDTTYYSKMARAQINDIAIALTVTDLQKIMKMRPSPECLELVRKLVTKKNYQLGLLSVVNAGDARRREAVLKKEALLYDSLIQVQLIKDGIFINSALLSAAVKNRKRLQLRSTQVDSLIEKGMYLTEMKDSAWQANAVAPFDAKDFENLWLSRILGDEQFSTLLGMKYLRDARINAENDWTDLEKRGLIKGMGKDTVINELTFYYMKVKSSTSMYAYDIDKQSAYARSIKEAAPPSLKLLQYARKNNIVNNDPQKKPEIK